MADCGVVLVIDRDARFRALAESVLGRTAHVVRTVANVSEAELVLDEGRPALVVVEVELPGVSGLTVLAQLLERFSDELPVILTSRERQAPLDRAAGLMLGADDYLVKPIDAGELAARVGRSLRRCRVPAAPATEAAPARIDDAGLSPRQLEILGLLVEGQTQKQIAETLVISPKTVGTHIQSLLARLGVHSRTQAVAEAFRRGLVVPDFEGHILTVGRD
jgi:DNA-binding NarL/FixJ family response regulator